MLEQNALQLPVQPFYETVMVKCLAQEYKRRDQVLNPRSAADNTRATCKFKCKETLQMN